ncbi:MAG: PAS domain-containing protein, partial [Desulfomonilaceae bacterium]
MDALRFSEEKYRLVVDHARQVILVAQNGIIKFINPYAAQLVETSSDNIIGKPFLNFVHPDDREKTFKNYTARLQGSQIPERYHLRVLTASQKLKWVEVYGHLIDWEGQMADLVFISDVTERKLSEDALRQSEENYRSIFNGAEDAIFIHDVQTGAVLDVNDRVTELYGYSKEESINSDFSLFCAEDEGFTTDKAAKRLHQAAQGHPQSFEWRARAKDGHSFWVDVHLRLVTLEGQDRILASVRDITEKKRLKNFY